ncbi:peptidoglycan D,D-transpeptidase FtsI family protein [Aerococcaceae bacterium WGS1372]
MTQKKNVNPNFNILIFIGVATLAFVLLGARFFQLNIAQTSHGENLSELIEVSNNPRSSIMEAKRGTIFDIQGQPIAIDTTSYSMYAILKEGNGYEQIQDVDYTAQVLSNYIDLSSDEILNILHNDQAVQVEFSQAGKSLNQDVRDAILAEKLPGIYFVSQSSRKYVNNYFSSHLVGYAIPEEIEGNNYLSADLLAGQIGVEAAYNNQLSGLDLLETDPALVASTNMLYGKDIYLTLDSRLQHYLEELLDYTYNKYEPEEISAYLVEVESGKLLTAAQRPSFNLNTLEGIEKQWANQLVEEPIEPGSTMKLLTQATAYDMNVYEEDELIQTGSVDIENVTVRDYNLYGWGEITFDEGLARSSNVTIVELVRRIGLDNWLDKLKEFGFGQKPNSGLANETTGTVEFDNPVSATMSGFGQGFAASPLQLLQAFTSIANDGKMMKIQYINGIEENSGYEPVELGQPISSESANHILNIMVDAVNESYGTARDYAMTEVPIAAKTGTAQIANPDGTGYMTGPNDYYFSVISFFPADNPKYMLYFTMKRPTNDHNLMGSQILAEIFKPFVEYITVYD